MPRLLILCEYPTVLGGERSMLSTLDAVQAAGFEIQFAAPQTGRLAEEIRSHGFPIVDWNAHDAAGTRRSLDEIRANLATILRDVRPDLAHANSLSTARIAGPVVAAEVLPSLGHIRDIVKLSPQAVADVNCHRRLVAVSRATRDFHVAQGIDARKCHAVHNGVDLAKFATRSATGYLHRELKVPVDVQFATVIGQIGLRKAMDVALTAAWQLASEFPQLHWLVVGERTSEKEESVDFEKLVHSIAEEPPLAGRVHFLGPRRDVDTLLNECTVLVHAARQEPLARVLLEAAASGTAIVATSVGGTEEIFPADAAAALLVPPNDAGAIAASVATLLRDAERRRTLGRRARQRAEAAFDVRDAAARLIEQYRAVL
jgi:glycosyltransferase involved in cell wall biosynthesis